MGEEKKKKGAEPPTPPRKKRKRGRRNGIPLVRACQEGGQLVDQVFLRKFRRKKEFLSRIRAAIRKKKGGKRSKER